MTDERDPESHGRPERRPADESDDFVRGVAGRSTDAQRLADEAFAETVLGALPDVLYAFDRKGRFLRWNDRATEVTGYTDAEIAEMHTLSFIPERFHDEVAAPFASVVEDRERVVEAVPLLTKAGTEIPYEFTGAPLVADDGEALAVVGIGRDVSERARYERELERQRAAIQAAFHGGFYEWPRHSTGEELAAAMGISGPTFHKHLRRGERTGFAVLFDAAGDSGGN